MLFVISHIALSISHDSPHLCRGLADACQISLILSLAWMPKNLQVL